jgi:hypothetical protein
MSYDEYQCQLNKEHSTNEDKETIAKGTTPDTSRVVSLIMI